MGRQTQPLPGQDLDPLLIGQVGTQLDDQGCTIKVPEASRSQQRAQELLEGGIITDSDLLGFLEGLELPQTRAQREAVFGKEEVHQHLWGLFRHGGIVNVTRLSKDKPFAARVLNRCLGQRFPGCFWTSVVVIKGGATMFHRDVQNAEGTFNHTFAVSRGSPGTIWVEGHGEERRELLTGATILGGSCSLQKGVVFAPTKWHSAEPGDSEQCWVIVGFTPRGYFAKGLTFEGFLKGLGFPLYPLSPPGTSYIDGLVAGRPQLRAIRAHVGPGRSIPNWPHPAAESTAVRTGLAAPPLSLRYLLQCEGTRVWGFLQNDRLAQEMRALAPGYRYTVALAVSGTMATAERQGLEFDSEATSSFDGDSRSISSEPDHEPEAADDGGGSRSSSEMWLPSEYNSSREEELNINMEFLRVHDFHDWDEEYRPDIVEERVLTWWRDENRIPWSPNIQGLNHSEIAGVHMMVGYLMQPPQHQDQTEFEGYPTVRSLGDSMLGLLNPVHLPAYLSAAEDDSPIPRLQMLEVVEDEQSSEPERTTRTLSQEPLGEVLGGVWEPGELEVELPAPEITPEAVEEAVQLHARTATAVRRLAREVEGWAEEPEMNQTLASLLQDQVTLRSSLEEWLVQAQSRSEASQVRALAMPQASEDHQGLSLTGEVPQDTFLHTRTVSLQEVRKELAQWVRPAEEELEALFNRTKACRRTTAQQVQEWVGQGVTVHVLPGKAVCARKAGIGKRRLRAVVCGNFMPSNAESADSTYASGIESVSVRAALAVASRRAWRPTGLDISTAFLNAPVRVPSKTVIVVKPPRLLVELQLVSEHERWIVDRALYGLTSSPRDWAVFRDDTLKELPVPSALGVLRLRQCRSDGNLWRLVCPQGYLQGVVIIYVDDIMCLAPQEQAESLWKALRATWKTTDPTWASLSEPLSFCGLEIYWSEEAIWIQQTRYLADLLQRYQVNQVAQSPMTVWNPPELPEQVEASEVKKAQKVTGELLWIATRSRPDISYSVGKLAQYSTKAPSAVKDWASQILRYLFHTQQLAIKYGSPVQVYGSNDQLQRPRAEGTLELYSDASHAPLGDRSQQGTIVMWQGDLIMWDAGKQPFTALSSAESELISMLATMNIGESVGPVFEEILEMDLEYHLYGDNLAACRAFQDSACNWRSRHLRMRACAGRERIQAGHWFVMHMPGTFQVADLNTKPLSGSRIQALLPLMGIGLFKPPVNGSNSSTSPTGANPVGTSSSSTAANQCQSLQANHSLPPHSAVEKVKSPSESRVSKTQAAALTVLLATLVQPGSGGSVLQYYEVALEGEPQWPIWTIVFFLAVVIVCWEIVKCGFRRLGRLQVGWLRAQGSLYPQLVVERKKTSGPDVWEWNLEGRMLRIQHRATRTRLFCPYDAKLPVELAKLSGIRVTYLVYVDGTGSELLVDSLLDATTLRQTRAKRWTGATIFILL